MSRSLSLIATPLLLALSACTTAAPPMPEPAMTDPNPSAAAASCNADQAKPGAIGKTATADVVEQARTDAGARTARVLKPDMMVTMEYQEGRLNLDVDDANVITNVRCG